MKTSFIEQIKLREAMNTVDSIVDLARTNPSAFAEKYGNKSVAEVIAPYLPKEEKKVVKVAKKPTIKLASNFTMIGGKAKATRKPSQKITRKKVIMENGWIVQLEYQGGKLINKIFCGTV